MEYYPIGRKNKKGRQKKLLEIPLMSGEIGLKEDDL